MPKKSDKVPWRKVLYLKQPYPDNYYDNTFLENLQTNANVRPYPYSALVQVTLPITAHLASILIYVVVFVHLYLGTLSPSFLLIFTHLGTVLGWIVTGCITPSPFLLLLPILIYLLSPTLRTLTESTTSDSIWALSAALFLLNFVLGSNVSDALVGLDHRYDNKPWLRSPRLPSALGLNAAIFGATVLASRLDSTISVCSFMIFSVVWFGLFPLARFYMRENKYLDSTLTVSLAIIACVTLSTLSLTVTAFFLFLSLGITFGIPAGIIWAQKYKNQIQGSWDVVIPKM